MKKTILLLISIVLCLNAMAQSKDFTQVYDACMLAQKAMDKGMGSNAEIAEASLKLDKANWVYLKLFADDVKGEVQFGKKTMVFTPEYLKQFSENKKLVYKKAREYAEEKAASMRGESKVKLCTKCVGGKKSVTYKIRQEGRTLDVAAVAEVNGLINLSVVVMDEKGKKSGPYKEHSDEFKGAKSRRIRIENMPKGNNTVFITIENKYNKARSVAILFE